MTDCLRTAVTVAITQQSNLPIQASPDVPDNSLRLANTGNASIKMFDLFNKWYEQKEKTYRYFSLALKISKVF